MLLAVSLAPGTALAWGAPGHEIVAAIAEDYVVQKTMTVEDLNFAFMRCSTCHEQEESRQFLLRQGCTPEPPLKVRDRAWFPPRGWAGSETAGRRTVLVLSTNPGHPLVEEERIWNDFPESPGDADGLTIEQANRQMAFVTKMYVEGGRGSTSFHTRSVQVARTLLWLVEESEGRPSGAGAWVERTWFSDVVKCSTVKETGSPGIPILSARCRRHLVAEVTLLQPQVLVTLGQGARLALADTGVSVPVIVTAPHPSGREWRRIDSPDWDGRLEAAATRLGLAWSEIAERLGGVRVSLAKRPRGPLRVT